MDRIPEQFKKEIGQYFDEDLSEESRASLIKQKGVWQAHCEAVRQLYKSCLVDWKFEQGRDPWDRIMPLINTKKTLE